MPPETIQHVVKTFNKSTAKFIILYHSIKQLENEYTVTLHADEIAKFDLKHMSNPNENDSHVSTEQVYVYKKKNHKTQNEVIEVKSSLQDVEKFFDLSDDQILQFCQEIVNNRSSSSRFTRSTTQKNVNFGKNSEMRDELEGSNVKPLFQLPEKNENTQVSTSEEHENDTEIDKKVNTIVYIIYHNTSKNL